jgi:hypothetical protein
MAFSLSRDSVRFRPPVRYVEQMAEVQPGNFARAGMRQDIIEKCEAERFVEDSFVGVEGPCGLVAAYGLDFVIADADVMLVEEERGGVDTLLRLLTNYYWDYWLLGLGG